MSLHKLSAGDGYTYLTRQVAAGDSALMGGSGLAAYYQQRGESPGVWIGAGLGPLGISGQVSEAQMKNLFGLGIHPDAEGLIDAARARGESVPAAAAATRLGSPYAAYGAEPLNTAWRAALANAYQETNRAAGLPGDWPIPEADRRAVRTTVAAELFGKTYGRAPSGEHELTSFMTLAARPGRVAVAGYDVTFSPVKSVSALWAIAPLPVAAEIAAAHDAAVAAAFAYLEHAAAYTRIGARGVGQVETRGLIGAAFVHRDSRAGDPDLHTHVAVSNKVQTLGGRWLALDGRMIYRQAVAASERYNTALEAELGRRLGLSFTPRTTEPGKRPVREITGVPQHLIATWSSRRDSIVAARTDLVDAYRAEHGRLPGPTEMIRLSQQATLKTREAKHEPRTLAEQRDTWRAQATRLLGAGGIDRVLEAVRSRSPRYRANDRELVEALADRTITAVAASRARWRTSNLTAEALRQIRAAGINPEDADRIAEQIVAVALDEQHAIPIGTDPEPATARPAELSRADGTSIFTVAGGRLYTSPAILAAETRLVAAAGRGGAATIGPGDIEIAMLEWSANHDGANLNTSQQQLVRQVAAGDRFVMLALAPAGTGKTTSMGVLATAWRSAGGTVVGLAPQASAAEVLAAALGGRADTVDKLAYDTAAGGPGARPEDWADIGPGTLVIIDEAALAGTLTLDTAVTYVTGRGGRVLLVGDDRQRAAAGAGGVLRDIETSHGAAYLDEVLRFTDPLEGAASLALRAGDTGAVGYYNDRGRIKEVTPDTATDTVYRAWAADIAAGAESVMIAPTLQMVRDLNARARADRLAAAGGPCGPEITLPTGEQISAGDVIVTKRNDRTLTLGGTDFVRNNQRWTVEEIHADGAITATEHGRDVTRILPAGYVMVGHVRLGYAATAASVQGTTIGSAHRRRGTAHAIITGSMSRNDAYPALTRATDANTAYVVVGGDGDRHDIINPDITLTPPTAVETLKDVIAKDGTSTSATTETRMAALPENQLGPAADAYATTIGVGAETLAGRETIAAIEAAVDAAVPGIVGTPAWETLRHHLAILASDHTVDAVIAAFTDAANSREHDTARDLAAVLDWRLDNTGRHSQKAGPLPWLPAIPAALRRHPNWGPYLAARAGKVTDLTDQLRATAASWTVDTAPAWALAYLDDSRLVVDLAVWRAAHQVLETDVRPAGPRPARIAEAHLYQKLVSRAEHATGSPTLLARVWATTITVTAGIDIGRDDYWPAVAARLAAAHHAGIDINSQLKRALARPLPAEAPAAALWWRLAAHIGDTTATRRAGRTATPAWTAALSDTLGTSLAGRITADPLWPAITVAIDRAARSGTDPRELAASAAGLLAAHTAGLPGFEAAPRLLAAITVLTDPTPPDDPDTLPPDPLEQETRMPDAPNQAPTVPHAPPTWHTPVPDTPPADPDTLPPDPADPEATGGPAATESAMLAAVADAWDYYQRLAPTSWVPTYLAGRGLTSDCAGYAPAGWTHLVDHLRRAGYTDTTIAASGLARTSSRGTLIDQFRDRAVLPIHNAAGHVVAFTGRANPNAPRPGGRPAPKYINTATTDLFHKNRSPYGLAPAAIRALQTGADLIIVEGPLDAQAINQTAPRRDDELPTLVAIAPLGTALTGGQLAAVDDIAPLAERTVILALDNDPAGRTAAAKAWPILASAGACDPAFVAWPGKDPASLLADADKDTLLAAIGAATPLAGRLIDDIITATVTDGFVEQRIAALRAAAPIVATLPERRRLQISGTLAEKLNLDTLSVIGEITRRLPTGSADPLGLPTPPVLSTAAQNTTRRAASTAPADRIAELRATPTASPTASGPTDPYEHPDQRPHQSRQPGPGPSIG